MTVVDGDELGSDPTLRPLADVGQATPTIQGPSKARPGRPSAAKPTGSRKPSSSSPTPPTGREDEAQPGPEGNPAPEPDRPTVDERKRVRQLREAGFVLRHGAWVRRSWS